MLDTGSGAAVSNGARQLMLNGTGHVLVSMFSSTLSKTSIAGAVARVSIPTVVLLYKKTREEKRGGETSDRAGNRAVGNHLFQGL